MNLVFFFLFFILVLIIFLKIKINIEYLNLNNIKNEKLNYEYLIKIGLYITNKIKLIEISLDKNKVNNKNLIEKIKNQYKKRKDNFKKYDKSELLKQIKLLKISIDKFKLRINFGTDNSIITSLTTATISSFIGIFMAEFIKNYKPENHYFIISPIYNNKNIINLSFKCVFCLKLIHIVYMLLKISKKDKKDVLAKRTLQLGRRWTM